MAKKSVKPVQEGGAKKHTKVVKMVKNNKGAYSFKEGIVHNDEVKDWFAKSK